MKVLVTGAAGFIGSTLTDRLLKDGHTVIGVDNLSTGRMRFLEAAQRFPTFQFFEKDLLDSNALNGILSSEIEWVFHLAANADVRDGLKHPAKDLEQNIRVTLHLLEAMRSKGVRRIVFSSTGSVYGNTEVIPTPEDVPMPLQTSLYATSKLAAEGLLTSYGEGLGFQTLVFRFVSILGDRYTHGHVYDFVKHLRKDPAVLPILGDGKQRKSYLDVDDCVEAMVQAVQHRWGLPASVFNLGTDETITVDQSADLICGELNVKPRRQYSGGDRGWPGDNPVIHLNCQKIRSLGWTPRKTISEALRRTVRYLVQNPWLLEERKPS